MNTLQLKTDCYRLYIDTIRPVFNSDYAHIPRMCYMKRYPKSVRFMKQCQMNFD